MIRQIVSYLAFHAKLPGFMDAVLILFEASPGQPLWSDSAAAGSIGYREWSFPVFLQLKKVQGRPLKMYPVLQSKDLLQLFPRM
jgi:hypothetical protein